MTAEIMTAYEEYRTDCYREGREPASLWAWLEGEE